MSFGVVINNPESIPTQVEPFEILLLGWLAIYIVDLLLNHLCVKWIKIHIERVGDACLFGAVRELVGLKVFSSN